LRDYGTDEQFGLEKTPEAYAANLVAVFREVKRVLRDDGTLWLNLGDSYSGNSLEVDFQPGNLNKNGGHSNRNGVGRVANLKPKNLVGIPWRVAFALQTDGWYLRSDIIWHKPNPMPESVTDRPTRAHEYIFLFSKSEHYFYDAEAIKEPIKTDRTPSRKAKTNGAGFSELRKGSPYDGTETHRNRRTIWTIAAGESFACPFCGEETNYGPVARETENQTLWTVLCVECGCCGPLAPDKKSALLAWGNNNKSDVWTITPHPYPEPHFATFPEGLPKLCILAGSKPGDSILDPFAGSGTTGKVAIELGRKAILIELNSAYIQLAEERCNITPGWY
jgi:site-specific DNA-methyltransferase (adenine-specific)